MITTIIFDLAEVYLNGLLGTEKRLEKILNLSAEEIYPKIRSEQLYPLFCGEITEEEYWQGIIKENGWSIRTAVLKKVVRENFQEIEGTKEIIRLLKKKRYRLGLLSDHAREWINHCEKKFKFHRLFHSRLYSFEASSCKVDGIIFKKILKSLKAKPKATLFVDDRDENLEKAKELGLKTIQFKNAEQLKKDLAKLKIFV